MILAALDVETDGVDKEKNQIIELGVALYSTGHRKFLDAVSILVKNPGVTITTEITALTGIQQSALTAFGYEPVDAFDTLIQFLADADAVIGHNIRYFDWPMIQKWAQRLNRELPEALLVDTMEDIPGIDGEQLITMCAKKGFVNPEQHSALFDAVSTMKLAMCYDIDAVVARSKVPTVIIQSLAARTNTNSEVKKYKFRWNPNHKIWWKAVKETDIEELKKKFPFEIAVLDKSISLEQLRD